MKMCPFWKPEWKNGDKPRAKWWKMAVFSANGTLGGGGGVLGDGQRKNEGKWREMGENWA